MNTEQFNSTQFNGIGIGGLIVAFTLLVLHSITKIPKKIRALGVLIATTRQNVINKILEVTAVIALEIVRATTTVKGYTVNLLLEKSLSTTLKIKDFGISISYAIEAVMVRIMELSVTIASNIKRDLSATKAYIANINLDRVLFLTSIKNLSIGIAFTIERLFARILDYGINITIGINRLFGRVLNYGIGIIYDKTVLTIKSFGYVIAIGIDSLLNRIFGLTVDVSFGISKLTTAVKSLTVNISQIKSVFISKIYNFAVAIAYEFIIAQVLVLNFVVSVGLSFTTNAKLVYLYWTKQLNPDILGFKILACDSPYGTFVQIGTTTDSHYVKTYLTTGNKWLKVIPYTSRGNLKYLLFKGIKLNV